MTYTGGNQLKALAERAQEHNTARHAGALPKSPIMHLGALHSVG